MALRIEKSTVTAAAADEPAGAAADEPVPPSVCVPFAWPLTADILTCSHSVVVD